MALDVDKFMLAIQSMKGTKFKHQGRVPGVAVDCVGLVVCALRAAEYPVKDLSGYSRVPSNGQLMLAILAHCNPINFTAIAVGDLMLFNFGHEPQHVAIVTGLDPVVLSHAYSEVGGVVENGFDLTWQQRLVGCFRFK